MLKKNKIEELVGHLHADMVCNTLDDFYQFACDDLYENEGTRSFERRLSENKHYTICIRVLSQSAYIKDTKQFIEAGKEYVFVYKMQPTNKYSPIKSMFFAAVYPHES